MHQPPPPHYPLIIDLSLKSVSHDVYAPKYKILRLTIKYSEVKVLGRKAHLIDFEEKLRCCTAKCEAKPSRENMKELDFPQADCNKL